MARKPATPQARESGTTDQLAKFKQMARVLGCDEDPAAFDAVLRGLAKAPPVHSVYKQCGEKHVHRYLAEYDFRYDNRIARGVDDTQRTGNAVRGIVGKRLMYRMAGRG